MLTKADYIQKGKRAYEIGVMRFPIAKPRGWQQCAERAGYELARVTWKLANPDADEWAAASARNAAFCKAVMKKEA